MRQPYLILLAIYLTLNVGCGRYTEKMTEAEATETLAALPQQTETEDEASVTGMNRLIEDLVAQGEVKPQGAARLAVSASTGKVDLSMINQFISLLQSQNGQKPNFLSIAQALIAMNNGNSTSTGSKLDTILALLNQLAPIIASIAPQYAGIIMAITTLLPLVMNIISMFKKPKPTASFDFRPVFSC